jgi:hypothetical protein
VTPALRRRTLAVSAHHAIGAVQMKAWLDKFEMAIATYRDRSSWINGHLIVARRWRSASFLSRRPSVQGIRKSRAPGLEQQSAPCRTPGVLMAGRRNASFNAKTGATTTEDHWVALVGLLRSSAALRVCRRLARRWLSRHARAPCREHVHQREAAGGNGPPALPRSARRQTVEHVPVTMRRALRTRTAMTSAEQKQRQH